MATVIAMFNHKGGVSKTTTTFHLGWKLARLGKRVLIVDADPQCNLTGLALGIEDYDSLFGFYDSRRNNDIFSALAPVFNMGNGEGNTIQSFGVTDIKDNENLKLLAGHVRFAELDMQIATAITSSAGLPVLRELVGAFNKLIREAALRMAADIVIIDMSPSISATNMCLLMGSDNFIVPTSPDFYCYQAIDSLSEVFPKWARTMSEFKNGVVLPRNNPKMMGLISQNYRVYTTDPNADKKTMTASYQRWADKIKKITNEKLVPSLNTHNMVISKEVFERNVKYDSPYNLANIQDLNTLIAISQRLSKPVFEITEKEYGSGTVWEHKTTNDKMVGAKYTVEELDKVYSEMGKAIIGMIQP
ncbi:MAG: AAA family ATPase [Rickettsiales bacterium]|jgi:cellulose biosynthesis protein BcsQ|nr:AAA family ATPase [Rickettsiales bacterium]